MQNGPGAEAEAKKSETESSGKDEKSAPSKEPPKPKIKSYDLPIDSAVPQLTAQDLKKFQDMELQMQIADRTEKEMMDAKNALEEYVYEMRGKLGERYQDFIKQQVCFIFLFFLRLSLRLVFMFKFLFHFSSGKEDGGGGGGEGRE